MALIDVERAVLSVCFKAEPAEDLLAALGDRRVWLMYREMARERLLREVHAALPRTWAAVEPTLIERTFSVYLDRDPPRSRFFRDVVLAFANSAAAQWREAALPARLIDLVGYEAALWEVADLEGRVLGFELREFAFDRVPVVSPALRLLEVRYPVHLPDAELGAAIENPAWLGVHRGPDSDRPQTWAFNRTTHALLADFQAAQRTAADSVQHVAGRLRRQVTPKFIDRLCETLAQWIEVGILLGSR